MIVPPLLDLQVQNNLHNEHIMKLARMRQLNSRQKRSNRAWRAQVVRLGAWLERIGCRLQGRFSPEQSIEFRSPLQDAHCHQC